MGKSETGKPGGIRSVALLALAMIAGCGAKSESFTPINGSVTVNGTQLTTGSVTFHPDTAKGNHSPHIPVGAIDAQGRYQVMTATKRGAPPGWYKVTVTAQEPIDPKNPYAPPKHLIPLRFSDASTSGLEVEVVETANAGAYDLKLAP
jgi:hypothetical protein